MTALPPLTAFAPLLLLGVAALSLSMSGRRPGLLPKLAEGATLGALGLALAGLVQIGRAHV